LIVVFAFANELIVTQVVSRRKSCLARIIECITSNPKMRETSADYTDYADSF
jgi:hypothetical protein